MLSAYLKYLLRAKDEHSLHSPFVFDFYMQVIKAREAYYAFDEIEQLRHRLLQDHRLLELKGFGAGSRHPSDKRLYKLVKRAAAPAKLGRLLFRAALYMHARTIVELGTHVGIATAYLAKSSTQARVYTFEGESSLLQVAQENFRSLNLHNITTIEGNIDETLAQHLPIIQRIDLLYIDANHRYEPTMRYVEQCLPYLNEDSLVVLDDIHWSAEMETAWQKLHRQAQFDISIDLFRCGLLFLRQKQPKQHFILRF